MNSTLPNYKGLSRKYFISAVKLLTVQMYLITTYMEWKARKTPTYVT